MWSVEEALTEYCHQIIVSLVCYNHGACTAILHSDVCRICIIVQLVVSNVYFFFLMNLPHLVMMNFFDSLRRTSIDGI